MTKLPQHHCNMAPQGYNLMSCAQKDTCINFSKASTKPKLDDVHHYDFALAPTARSWQLTSPAMPTVQSTQAR